MIVRTAILALVLTLAACKHEAPACPSITGDGEGGPTVVQCPDSGKGAPALN